MVSQRYPCLPASRVFTVMLYYTDTRYMFLKCDCLWFCFSEGQSKQGRKHTVFSTTLFYALLGVTGSKMKHPQQPYYFSIWHWFYSHLNCWKSEPSPNKTINTKLAIKPTLRGRPPWTARHETKRFILETDTPSKRLHRHANQQAVVRVPGGSTAINYITHIGMCRPQGIIFEHF